MSHIGYQRKSLILENGWPYISTASTADILTLSTARRKRPTRRDQPRLTRSLRHMFENQFKIKECKSK